MAGSQVGHRPEANRELARTLLSSPVGDDMDYDYLRRTHGAAEVTATKDELVRSQLPLTQFEPRMDGSLSRGPKDRLLTIGCAVRPDLSGDQARMWVDAMLVKLADLPPTVLVKALDRALHVPFQFPSEVEGKVRDLAEEHMARIRAAITRCDRILDYTAPPQRKQDPPLHEGETVLPDDLVHRLQTHAMGQSVVALGKRLGYVTDAQTAPPDLTD